MSKSQVADIAYDYAERLFLTVLGLGVIWRFLPTLADHPANAILLASECAAVGFIIVRRRAQRTDLSITVVLIALAGTTAGLLVKPGGTPAVTEWIGGLAMITGALLNIAAKVSLNRSFGLVAANRGVKRQGPYRFIRHPMYAGYIITQAGFLLANPTAWNMAVYAAAWMLQFLRIHAEERVLMDDQAYRDYAFAVPYRLAPGVY